MEIDGASAGEMGNVEHHEDDIVFTGDLEEDEEVDKQAIDGFDNSQKRLRKKNQGKEEGKEVDAQLMITMGMSFLDRTTTHNETDVLNYYWWLAKEPNFEHKVMRVYGYGLKSM